jgi:hypothetical protein
MICAMVRFVVAPGGHAEVTQPSEVDMSTSAIVVLVIVVVLIVAGAALLMNRMRTRPRFKVHPLSDEERKSFEANWSRLQEHFVDAPADTVADADRLITELLAKIGYPTAGFEQQADDLSRQHRKVATSYRRAHGVLVDQSTSDDENAQPTDDLRRALLDYRSVFDAVVGHERTKSNA